MFYPCAMFGCAVCSAITMEPMMDVVRMWRKLKE